MGTLRRKTHVITKAVTEHNDGGKLGCDMPALDNRGTLNECTKDDTGRKHNSFYPGKWDEERFWLDERNGTLASYSYNLRRSGDDDG